MEQLSATKSPEARPGRGGHSRRAALLLVPVVALYGCLFAYPLYLIFARSVADDFGSFDKVFDNPVLGRVLTNTAIISASTTVIAVVCAYLLAAAIWRTHGVIRLLLLAFVLLPFWTGVLVKNFAWAAVLQDNGVVNDLLGAVGISDQTLLRTRTAVIIGMVHYVLPYAVFPILAAMVAIDDRLLRAAASLGAPPRQIVLRVILPLTLPGAYAAALLVFIISIGFFITPALLGSPSDFMISNLIDFYANDLVDFGAASVLAVLVTAAVSVLIVVYQRLPKEGQFASG